MHVFNFFLQISIGVYIKTLFRGSHSINIQFCPFPLSLSLVLFISIDEQQNKTEAREKETEK